MAITTDAGLKAAFAGGQRITFGRDVLTGEGFGTWISLWKAAGYPAAGATPPAYTAGSGYAPDYSTTGALPFVNPSSATTYLLRAASQQQWNAAAPVAPVYSSVLTLYQRIWHCSGMSMNSGSAQTITTPGTADASGVGVEIWGEIYTAGGATAATWTISYTDQDGNTGQTASYAHPNNAETANQMFPFTLAAGDTGARAVASATLSATGTAGDFGITLLKRICEIPIRPAGEFTVLGPYETGLITIPDSACLAFMASCNTTAFGPITGSLVLGQA